MPKTAQTISREAADAILNAVSVQTGDTQISYGELRKANTLSDVRGLYATKGRTFSDDHALMDQLRKDWGEIRWQVLQTASTLPPPERYPVRTVEGHGVPIRIIGMMHVYKADTEVHRLFRETILQFPSLITEQNLGRSNFGLHSHGVELADHAVDGVWRNALTQHVRTWRSFPRILKSFLPPLSALGGQTSKDGLPLDVRAVRRLTADTGIDFSPPARASVWVRGDEWSQAPSAVDLEYRGRYGLRYSESQRRSAYMAEVIRRWDPSRTFADLPSEVSDDVRKAALEQKPFLCGAAHVPDMEYFLQHGCKDTRILARAAAHAALLNQPDGLSKLASRGAQLRFVATALSTGLQMLEGSVAAVFFTKALLGVLFR
jgi:hypothetical protein